MQENPVSNTLSLPPERAKDTPDFEVHIKDGDSDTETLLSSSAGMSPQNSSSDAAASSLSPPSSPPQPNPIYSRHRQRAYNDDRSALFSVEASRHSLDIAHRRARKLEMEIREEHELEITQLQEEKRKRKEN